MAPVTRLSLGLINGDFFKSIVAFSPGFVISGDLHGQPRIFISHGTTITFFRSIVVAGASPRELKS